MLIHISKVLNTHLFPFTLFAKKLLYENSVPPLSMDFVGSLCTLPVLTQIVYTRHLTVQYNSVSLWYNLDILIEGNTKFV